jgi:hypothetical protein
MGMKAPRFSSVELRVQAIASREASNQLLRVLWGRFRKAYEEYPRWQALALWVEAVIGTERRPPSPLSATLTSIVPVSSRGARDQNNPNPLRPFELDGASRYVSRLHADAEVRNRSAATVTDIWQARHNSGSSRPVLRTDLQTCS